MTDANIIIMLSDLFEGEQFRDRVIAETAIHLSAARQEVQDTIMRTEMEEMEKSLDNFQVPEVAAATKEDIGIDLPEDKYPIVIMEDALEGLREAADYSKTKAAQICNLTLAGYSTIEEDGKNGRTRNRNIRTIKGLNTLFAHYSKHSRPAVRNLYKQFLDKRSEKVTVPA